MKFTLAGPNLKGDILLWVGGWAQEHSYLFKVHFVYSLHPPTGDPYLIYATRPNLDLPNVSPLLCFFFSLKFIVIYNYHF